MRTFCGDATLPFWFCFTKSPSQWELTVEGKNFPSSCKSFFQEEIRFRKFFAIQDLANRKLSIFKEMWVAWRCIVAGTWHKNDVVWTSMRQDDVASTLIWCHFGTICPLGSLYLNWHNKAPPLASWNLVVEWTCGRGHYCQAASFQGMEDW